MYGMMEQNENFSDDSQENLRIENEILKIKLKAQYGDAFHMETNAGLPPEIENQFLKSMMAFEDEYASAEYTTVYARIGKPEIQATEDMSRAAVSSALRKLIALLEQHDISLRIIDGPYPDEVIYRFITEELFALKIEKKPVAGMGANFIYEEFYPNHKADIIKRTHTFLKHWFSRSFNEYCTELSWHCTTSDGLHLTREDVINKMNIFFEAFEEFKDDGYNIDNTSFELLDDSQRGMGFAEGMLKYDAVMENGELIHYEGPYKLYMQMEDNWWSIFYFVMPGFKW
jgi:hypothetical protein